MQIEKITNLIAQENTYLLSNPSFSLIIDPGSDASSILQALSKNKKPLAGILLTHAHFDHIMGLDALKAAYPKAPIFLHEAEKDWLQRPELNASLLMMHQAVTSAYQPDEFYQLNSDYQLGDFTFRVRYTPGHSIGGVSLVFEAEQVVFTGDALFRNSIGRTDLPTGNHEQLINSVKSQLFSLADSYKIYPGHGAMSSIHSEKHYNPFF